MNKAYRQGQILKLLRGKNISTQDELARELGLLGVAATQVTLSRDIRELGLVKTSEGYQLMPADSSGPDLATVLSEFLQDVRAAQNLVVIKTSSAHASSVAVALDHEELEDIVGTIAGDDTILVITPDSEAAKRLSERLLAMAEE